MSIHLDWFDIALIKTFAAGLAIAVVLSFRGRWPVTALAPAAVPSPPPPVDTPTIPRP